jgi:hypothetical protein
MTLPTAANQDKCDYCDKGDIELTKYDVSPAVVWSIPIDIMMQYSSMSRRNCVQIVLANRYIIGSSNLYFLKETQKLLSGRI